VKKYLYEQVAEQLAVAIRKGNYADHQKLPAESDLAKKYGTSRLTMRKAIDVLQRQHVVVKDRNRGTYVLAPMMPEKISSGADGLSGFTEVALKMHLHPETRVLRLTKLTVVPEHVQAALQVAGDEPLWRIERLRLIDQQPMTVEQLYVRIATLPDLTISEASGSLYAQLEETLTIGYASQELEAILMDARIANLLTVPTGAAGFLSHAVTFSVDGYPILYDDSYYRSDKYTFHNILYRHH